MKNLTHRLCIAVESLARPFGIDLYIEPMSRPGGPFRFSREVHSGGDKEYWGLGLYVVVSSLRKPAQV